MHPIFDSRDSDILVHNPNIQNCFVTPKSRFPKRDHEDIQSTDSWSESPCPQDSKGLSAVDFSDIIVENLYEKRPRKKMVQDPLTGTINLNPRKDKSKRKTTKVSRSNMFSDLGPLNRFDSKFLGKNRLSVGPLFILFTIV